MYKPVDVRLSDIDRYVVLDQSGSVSMEAVSDRLLIATDGKVSYSVELDFAEGRAVKKRIAGASDYVMICDGKALLANRDEYCIADASGGRLNTADSLTRKFLRSILTMPKLPAT